MQCGFCVTNFLILSFIRLSNLLDGRCLCFQIFFIGFSHKFKIKNIICAQLFPLFAFALPATGLAYTLHWVLFFFFLFCISYNFFLKSKYHCIFQKSAITQITIPEKPIKLLTKCNYFPSGKINQLCCFVLKPVYKNQLLSWLELTKGTTWLQTLSTLKALAYSLISGWKPIAPICSAVLTQHSLRNLLAKHILLSFNKI